MEPEEYRQLEVIASTQGTSVSSLVRRAVRERFRLVDMDERLRAAEEIAALEIPDLPEDPAELSREIQDARAAGLP